MRVLIVNICSNKKIEVTEKIYKIINISTFLPIITFEILKYFRNRFF